MAIDPMTASLIADVGGSVVGGVAGRARGKDKPIRWRNQKRVIRGNVRNLEAMHDQYYKSSFENAKKYGVHPLYALNIKPSAGQAPTTGSSSSSDYGAAQAISDMGGAVGDYFRGKQTAQQRTLLNKQIDVLEAQANKDNAIAGYYASRGAMGRQSNVVTTPLPDQPALQMRRSEGVPIYQENITAPDMFVKQAKAHSSARSSHPGASPGSGPSVDEFTMASGQRIFLPGTEEGTSELRENLKLSDLPYLYKQNVQMQGHQNTIKALSEWTGFPADRVLDFIKRKQGQIRTEYERRSQSFRRRPYYR